MQNISRLVKYFAQHDHTPPPMVSKLMPGVGQSVFDEKGQAVGRVQPMADGSVELTSPNGALESPPVGKR